MVRREHLLAMIAVCLLAVTFQVQAGDVKILELPDPYEDPESFLLMNLRVSDLMVKGTVLGVNDSVSTEEGFDPVTRTPGELYTFVTLQVDSVLKGNHNAPTLTFWHSGGRRWGYSHFSTVQSRFVVGSTIVVLLDSRALTIPLAESLTSPPYQFKGKPLHYVIHDGSVYRAQDIPRSVFGEEGGDESHIEAVPVFGLPSMLEAASGYLRSTSIESLAVKADVIAVGKVISRRAAVDDNATPSEVPEFGRGPIRPELIVFGGGVIVKSDASHMPLEIMSAGITDPIIGCAYDKAVFPDNERILVFLQGPTNGVYRPLDYWKATRVLRNETEETAAIRRISAVLDD